MPSGSYLISMAIAVAMSAVAFFVGMPSPGTADAGICIHSVNLWGIAPIAAWALNIALALALSIGLRFANKAYSFVPGSETPLPGLFLVLFASNTWISGPLTSSVILAAANLICLSTLFSCFRQNNATQETFVIATILSLGSMFQYAFAFMIPVYIIAGIMLKCFRLREAVAMILGLVAPYWVAVGLGIVPVENFHLPKFENLFDGYISKADLFTGLLNCAFTLVLSLILALNNIVKLYSGNSRRRLFNMAMLVLAVACAVCMILDFNNITAYLATVYMVTAVQIANLLSLFNIRRPAIWIAVIEAVYVALFVLMLSFS